jgi:hypothetical protein
MKQGQLFLFLLKWTCSCFSLSQAWCILFLILLLCCSALVILVHEEIVQAGRKSFSLHRSSWIRLELLVGDRRLGHILLSDVEISTAVNKVLHFIEGFYKWYYYYYIYAKQIRHYSPTKVWVSKTLPTTACLAQSCPWSWTIPLSSCSSLSPDAPQASH